MAGQEWKEHRLPNGIRLLHWPVMSKVAHAGVFLQAGSRDETEPENGMAHFIEHMIFKGTKRRKSFQILSHLENVGGDLNAFTSKEDTCIYASFLVEHTRRTFALFSDIIFSPVFPERELRKEKEVILDEINSYLDTPSEQIFDDFEDQLFNGHALGRNILGTKENLKRFDRNDILAFIRKNYRAEEIYICYVGSMSFRRLVKLIEKYFSDCPWPTGEHTRMAVNGYSPSSLAFNRNGYQAHGMIGNRAYPANDEKSLVLALTNNILGGPGMNSRLNMAVRERHGLSYHIESAYQPYSDTGVFEVYLGSEDESLGRAMELAQKEMDKLRTQRLGALQLSRAKQQLKGQIAILEESNLNLMLSLGKSLLLKSRIDTIEDVYARIDAIQADHILEVSNEIFEPSQLSTLVFRCK
ncbi:MAG: insulinase family protein [Lentimicrobiaceae bacterium]|nr:insulinase family protein [Lentimicrobiaceae bacterium]